MYPEILFFTSVHCSPCKSVARLVERINVSMFGNKIIIRKIEISDSANAKIVQKYSIYSVPTLIIGNRRFSGTLDKDDLVDAILQAFLSSVSLEDE